MTDVPPEIRELVAGNKQGTKVLLEDLYSSEEWEVLKKNTWFETYTGRKFRAFDPQPEDIHIQDIAHHLALVNRFNGATRVPLSVAQHSLHCMERVPEPFRLEALMHDSSEAYIMDVPRPWKPFFSNYKLCEEQLMTVIADKFGFQFPLPEVIHTVDNRMLYTEATQLLPGCEWADYKFLYNDLVIQEMDWRQVERGFLLNFARLKR